jgi:hypothetical protein
MTSIIPFIITTIPQIVSTKEMTEKLQVEVGNRNPERIIRWDPFRVPLHLEIEILKELLGGIRFGSHFIWKCISK